MNALVRGLGYRLLVLALLAGCGGSQSPIGTPGTISKAPPIEARVESDGSWMLPEAKSEDLLYVTNYSDVLVFSYPYGKLVGELKGFFSNVGECVDSNGDVFVTNDHPEDVYEYAHGDTKRIATLVDKRAGSQGCAINPVNGDLVASGVSSYVDIFKGAKGKASSIRDDDMWYGEFVTYDNDGNLFFLGLKNSKGKPRLSELPSGSGHFVDIKPNAYMYDEGGIQWHNGYLTAVSFARKPRTTAIAQFQITGTKAHEVGLTLLGAPADTVLQYFIDGAAIFIPNIAKSSGSNVLVYNYPAGGEPIATFTKGILAARGAVISHATKR